TDRIIKTIDFGQVEGTFFSISNSGDRLLYSNAGGLYVTDLDFQNKIKIYTPKDLSTGARWPSFSNDDSKIAFSIGEPLTMQKCLYDFSTGEIITIDYNSYYTFWPKNSDGFIACDDAFVRESDNDIHASFKYFNLKGDEINAVNISTGIYPIRATEDYMVYYQNVQTIQRLTETGFRDCKIKLWNFKSGELKALDIGYQIQEIWSYQASNEGNKLLMFMTVVIDGKAVSKVLWVDLGG
ncbi:MAG TPA: hypothetical protein PKH29_12225, partial [Oscillospiraceae bacterium]|nr:hypothetical protein [Oscillospiraceae bacterium]